LTFLDVHLAKGQFWEQAVSSQHTVVIYVYTGELTVNPEGRVVRAGQLGRLINGDTLGLETKETGAHFIVLAAKPLNEPVVQSGPFVMNTVAEIEQAYRDYRDGALTL
jgi:redox-sensitive bicupin YhaK (pirin superfamily)